MKNLILKRREKKSEHFNFQHVLSIHSGFDRKCSSMCAAATGSSCYCPINFFQDHAVAFSDANL